MDCLDRTNVVQSVIAKTVLQSILAKAQQGSSDITPTMDKVFRELWSKNADVLSILYTGTPALKTDYTRTGKRTKIGAINDGKNGFIRYFLGNFMDH